jgi:CBS domain-containing protein
MAFVPLSKLKVEDLMSAPLAVSSTTNVRDAAILLARAGVSAIPVASPASKYEGLIGDLAIAAKLSDATRGFYSPGEIRAGVPLMGEPMPDPIWKEFRRIGWMSASEVAWPIPPLRPSDSLHSALEAMRRYSLPSMPVVANGRILGILSMDALTLRLLEIALSPEG